MRDDSKSGPVPEAPTCTTHHVSGVRDGRATALGIAGCWSGASSWLLGLAAEQASEFGEMDIGVHMDPRLCTLLRGLYFFGYEGADRPNLASLADECVRQDPEGVSHG